MIPQPATNSEPSISMPTTRLIVAIVGADLVALALWMSAVTIGPWGEDVLRAGPFGAMAVIIPGLLGVLVMMPWKNREISLWWTMWLAATTLRMLLTPALAFLLYSATSLNPEALCLMIASTYFLTLMTEATVITRHVNRVLQP